MPRTKVSKTSKRFREESEKVREFEASLDNFLGAMDRKGNQVMMDIDSLINLLISRTNSTLLQMRMGDFLDMNLAKFNDWNSKSNSSLIASSNASARSQSMLNGTKALNPNDEGYLTEDSSNGGSAIGVGALAVFTSVTRSSCNTQQTASISSLASATQQRGRTPGPLNSARARNPRRSRSACGNYVHGSALAPKPSATSSNGTLEAHGSRSKMRTPMATRAKAFSAERTPRQSRYAKNSLHSPPAAFFRWPKPGEVVLSQCGSPLVAQVLPDNYANVNIPVRNGVLSLRPKKLSEMQPDLIKDIDAETMNQIKTLHANLNLIMKMADSSK